MPSKVYIQYIEDNIDTQKLAKIFLRDIGDFDCFNHTENILQILAEKNYDLIL